MTPMASRFPLLPDVEQSYVSEAGRGGRADDRSSRGIDGVLHQPGCVRYERRQGLTALLNGPNLIPISAF
jgi:hypothetical protein